MPSIYFSYNQATPQQNDELVSFAKKLDEADAKGDNRAFLDVVISLNAYQNEKPNANIWGQSIPVCCEGRNGVLHNELRALAAAAKPKNTKKTENNG